MSRWAPRLVLALALLGACGRGAPPARDTTTAVAVAPATDGPKPLCPRTGHWTSCLVQARLHAAGVAPRPDSASVELPSLGVAPIRYRVGRASLAVYLYPDTLARARAARSLDGQRFIDPSAALTIRGEATAIQNDNLLALHFSRIDQERERVSDVLMAGAPQP